MIEERIIGEVYGADTPKGRTGQGTQTIGDGKKIHSHGAGNQRYGEGTGRKKWQRFLEIDIAGSDTGNGYFQEVGCGRTVIREITESQVFPAKAVLD